MLVRSRFFARVFVFAMFIWIHLVAQLGLKNRQSPSVARGFL